MRGHTEQLHGAATRSSCEERKPRRLGCPKTTPWCGMDKERLRAGTHSPRCRPSLNTAAESSFALRLPSDGQDESSIKVSWDGSSKGLCRCWIEEVGKGYVRDCCGCRYTTHADKSGSLEHSECYEASQVGRRQTYSRTCLKAFPTCASDAGAEKFERQPLPLPWAADCGQYDS